MSEKLESKIPEGAMEKLEKEKFVYYSIDPSEQLFKQLSGFLYFLRMAKQRNKRLILPVFKLREGNFKYEELFDPVPIGENFDVIAFRSFQEISKKNIAVNRNTEAWIDGFWQFPYNHSEYMNYRKHTKFHKNLRKFASEFLKDKEPYISAHWRQDDFLNIRPQVVMKKEELVDDIKKKLTKYKINKVYLSTDCKNEEHLKYIHENLPIFKLENKDLKNPYLAIIESIICSKAVHFTGTFSSLFSIYITGERILAGYDQEFTEIKNVNNQDINQPLKKA